jgi:acetylornithine/N-succinyldiaminopimelate aminotransferase
MQQGFEPIPQGFLQAPFNDMKSLKHLIDDQTAAVIIEPIQGEGGIHEADEAFLRDLRVLCTQEDLVLIFDEIQCGIGRTGTFFAKEHIRVQPDIMTLAKALGGGFPVGAVLSSEKVSAAMDFGDHGTTFGGNPLACAAALATLEVIEKEELVLQAKEKGRWLTLQLEAWEEPSIREIRGRGLMIGIEFEFETKPLVQKMLEKGVLANATAGNVLRLVPPLNISYEDLDRVLTILKESVAEIQ